MCNEGTTRASVVLTLMKSLALGVTSFSSQSAVRQWSTLMLSGYYGLQYAQMCGPYPLSYYYIQDCVELELIFDTNFLSGRRTTGIPAKAYIFGARQRSYCSYRGVRLARAANDGVRYYLYDKYHKGRFHARHLWHVV